MKRIHYVRHGLSEDNVAGVWSGGRSNPKLAEEGRHQARAAGKMAKAQGLSFDTIVASPLDRTVETATLIADELGIPHDAIVLSDLLIERDFGDYEGAPHDPDNLDIYAHPSVEQWDDLVARAAQAHDFIESLDGINILVVSHGSFGRAYRYHIHGDAIDREQRLPNADLFLLIDAPKA